MASALLVKVDHGVLIVNHGVAHLAPEPQFVCLDVIGLYFHWTSPGNHDSMLVIYIIGGVRAGHMDEAVSKISDAVHCLYCDGGNYRLCLAVWLLVSNASLLLVCVFIHAATIVVAFVFGSCGEISAAATAVWSIIILVHASIILVKSIAE